ncbi:hypothetical protein [Methylobacterium nonmethylotrophicum]|uniref:Motility protein n=1 Tax=Methylobacterium nonmethylotrophicum TaxID=1141884 RepID=A0A4Z0NWQ3_9HYPH|nr:hypothetical protein [Methylobacterium nonmethylotrophicum]TGE01717.1 hypothetical protein EU555_03320 [Methylobacterium nonmethylotrophicum]
MTALDTASLAAGAATLQGAAFSQQIATLAVRRQLDAERDVAGLVAQAATAPAPPGQGQVLDIRV